MQKKTIIVGAGVAGKQLAEEIKSKPGAGYKLIGFIDDDLKKLGKSVKGTPILGVTESLYKLVRELEVETIIIAVPSASGQTIRRILERARGLKINFKIVPRTLEVVRGKAKLEEVRDIELSDLFGREIVKSKQPTLERKFKGKRILVTGAAGSIGSELCRQIVQFHPEKLLAFDWWENGLFYLQNELSRLSSEVDIGYVVGNVQDEAVVKKSIMKLRPHYLFHAAGFKHVPLMQSNPLEAIRNNVLATENVAKIASEEGVEAFVYISTDKAADPVSIMGVTKLIGEHIITSLNRLSKTRYCAVRFGNVMESHGSVLPLFRSQIAGGGPVTVTDPKMTRFFMSIPEAVQLVLAATVLGKGGEVFVLEMGEQVKVDNVARLMIQLHGFVPDRDIKIKYIGSRPGEKFEERLFGANEKLTTAMTGKKNRIYKITHSEVLDSDNLSLLKSAVDLGDVAMAITGLKKVAPNLAKLPE